MIRVGLVHLAVASYNRFSSPRYILKLAVLFAVDLSVKLNGMILQLVDTR